MIKVNRILEEQKKLLVLYMFLTKTELGRKIKLKDLFDKYLEYARKYVSTRYVFGRNEFQETLKEFGIRRVKQDFNYWILPEKYYYQDLIDLIERRTEEVKEKIKIKEERGDKK